jgi:integrase
MTRRIVAPRAAIHRLPERTIKNLKAVGRHADGNGLYLSISANGGRRWTFLYVINCKQREMGFGSAAKVTAEEARAKAVAAQKLLAAGLDPLEMKGAPAAALVAIEARTFQQDGDEFLRIRSARLKPSSRRYWLYTFGRYPELLQKPVAEVSEADILTALAPRTDEGKKRAFWIFRKILAWSKDQKHIATNPLGFKLESKIPLPRTPTDKHLPAMPFGNVPAFMSKLREDDMLASLCIQWIILSACRNTEGRDARWSEVDEKAGLWSIPASRMKQSRDHVVPLSSQALALLARLPRSSSRLFPGRKADTPLSPLPLYKLIPEGVTLHGFRTSFAGWAFEGGYPIPWIDLALAHIIGGQITRAYIRGTLVAERRPMMQRWGDFLDGAEILQKVDDPGEYRRGLSQLSTVTANYVG